MAASTEPVARAVERLGGGVVLGLSDAVCEGDAEGGGDGRASLAVDGGGDGERDGEGVVGLGSVAEPDEASTACVGASGSA
ncbi:hypothetical protein [Streptomyces sp. NPDC057302]|uniref:hypothetical protein n=1 Tax=Streptomyces sp. NPDC057302 TaxID=3346094 RepID=UPI00362DC2D8